MASFHDLRVGETLCLRGVGEVKVTLRAKSGRRARLEIVADNGVMIQPADDLAKIRLSLGTDNDPHRVTTTAHPWR